MPVLAFAPAPTGSGTPGKAGAMLRTLRAALAIAAIWAAVWMPMGLALALYAGSRPPRPSDVISRPVTVPLFVALWTVWGGISGMVFALIVGLAERRRTLHQLRLARVAIWGAFGCMTLPVVLALLDVIVTPAALRPYGWRYPLMALTVSAALGAACAAGTLALGRRSP